tara:strand:+ start:380 stop:766 length:387 start_codon:yes stop_codon:yes gene_type:complete
MAKPMPYNEAVGDMICEQLAEGKSLVKILKKPKMPSYSTVMKWLRLNDDFAQNYARAREDSADNDFDNVRDIGDQVRQGLLDPAAARVAIDALKWTAGKMKPKKYGDKLDLDVKGSFSVVIKGDDADL